ncbi:MAG: hypothetical protein KDD40_00760 [Bdellovibrionales bacterium]|nr:hypothetical protein [Bdellovibrionales bacterium]
MKMTSENCSKAGGTWNDSHERCIFPKLTDSGNICHKHSDCQGVCVVQLTEKQKSLLIKEFGKHKFKAKGKCSNNKLGPSCLPNITKKGWVDGIICE